MSEPDAANDQHPHNGPPEQSTRLWLDEIADRFDAAWQSALRGSPRPIIEDFLLDASGQRRPELLRELILLDVEFRRRAGETPNSDDYAVRFSEQSDWLTDLLLPATEIPAPPPITKRFKPKPGEQLGDYELLEEIGQGGMGRVFKARHAKLKRVVALKMILAGQLATDELVQRFRNEAQAAANLDHSGIVPVFDVGEQDGLHFYTMGFVEGESLAKRISSGPLPPRDAAEIVRQVADAVHHAHEHGVIHRDLKPGNILLVRPSEEVRKTGGSGSPRFASQSLPGSSRRFAEQSTVPNLASTTQTFEAKVTDFGLAKLLDSDSGLSLTGHVLGTPSYMPPEQARGQHAEVGRAADVYSLGAVLYCLLTGRPPFQAASHAETLDQVIHQAPVPPRQFNPSLPRDLETLCLKCLEKDPSRRFSTTAAFSQELSRFLNHEPILSRPNSRIEKAWLWCQKEPAIASLSAAVVLSLLVGTIVSLYFAVREYHAAAEEKRQTDIAKQRANDLKKANHLTKRNLYTAHMNLAQSAWQDARIGTVRDLLDRHRNPPSDDEDFRGFEWYYLDRLCQSDILTLKGHSMAVSGLAFNPDGRLLASGSMDGTIRVWDAMTGQQSLAFEGKKGLGYVTNVAFSPDGTLLAATTAYDAVMVWDARNGTERFILKGHDGWVRGVAFSPDGKQLASAGCDSLVKIWDAKSGRELLVLKGHTNWVRSVVFSPDGQLLATCGNDNTVRVWDTQFGKELHTLNGHRHGVACVAFSPNGQRIASAGDDETARLWDVTTAKEILKLTPAGNSVAFSSDGRHLVSSDADSTIRLWDATSGQELRTFKGHTGAINSAIFSPGDQRLASGSEDGTVRIWDASGQESRSLEGHSREVHGVEFSPDGKWLASASSDETIKIWDAATGITTRTLTGHVGRVNKVVFSPVDHRLASAGNDRTVKVWDTTTGQVTKTLDAHNGHVYCVAFSSDGKQLASASHDQTIKIWDAMRGTVTSSLDDHSPVYCVAFSPDGRSLASTSGGVAFAHDGSRLASTDTHAEVKIWDVATGRKRLSLSGHTGWLMSVAFSEDGQKIASAGGDATVRVWETATGKLLHTLTGHKYAVFSVTFSSDGRRLFSAGVDGVVRIWDVDSGEEVLTLKGPFGAIWGISVSPDGRRLAAACNKSLVTVWDSSSWTPELKVEEQAISLIRFLSQKGISKLEMLKEISACPSIDDRVRAHATKLVTP